MNEINDSKNLNSHYTNSPKVEKKKLVVAKPPEKIPEYVLYKDQFANERLNALNNDIYVQTLNANPKKKKKKHWIV